MIGTMKSKNTEMKLWVLWVELERGAEGSV